MGGYKCKLCGRPLKNKDSIKRGCGKSCEGKLKTYNNGVKLDKWLNND